MTHSPIPVVISGKICSGKNYLSETLTLALESQGYTTAETAFGSFVKNELSTIITATYDGLLAGLTREKILAEISDVQSLTRAESALILDTIIDTVHGTIMAEAPRVDGWSRSSGIRRGCQVLGTDIRRAKDDDYWVKRTGEFVDAQPVDFVLVPDGRFPNEMSLAAGRGIGIRLEVPLAVREERLWSRDGRKFTKEELEHKSETSLNEYDKFDLIVDHTYSLDEVTKRVVAVL